MPPHASLLAVLLDQRPTCPDCVAAKSGLTVSQVNAYLTVISAALESFVSIANASALGSRGVRV
jgi:hypothetical protein